MIVTKSCMALFTFEILKFTPTHWVEKCAYKTTSTQWVAPTRRPTGSTQWVNPVGQPSGSTQRKKQRTDPKCFKIIFIS